MQPQQLLSSKTVPVATPYALWSGYTGLIWLLKKFCMVFQCEQLLAETTYLQLPLQKFPCFACALRDSWLQSRKLRHL